MTLLRGRHTAVDVRGTRNGFALDNAMIEIKEWDKLGFILSPGLTYHHLSFLLEVNIRMWGSCEDASRWFGIANKPPGYELIEHVKVTYLSVTTDLEVFVLLGYSSC